MADPFDPSAALAALADATAVLLATMDRLDDAAAREPSLLPGWTRGHVATHLARNAEGGTRLLVGVRSGHPGEEYPSLAARAAAIEAGAGRPAVELVRDVRATAGRLAAAATDVPADAWSHAVRWTGGQHTPAAMVVESRRAEVLIHLVDLDLGVGTESWPGEFVRRTLDLVAGSLGRRPGLPAQVLLATDTGLRRALAGPGDPVTVAGAEARLLAWLLGRSDGRDLRREPAGPLPDVPPIY